MGRAPWQPLYEYFILCTTRHGIGMIHENTEPPLCSVVMNGLVLQYKFADDKVPRTDPSDRYASAAESNSIPTDSSSTQLLCYLRHYWVQTITKCPQLDTPTTPSARHCAWFTRLSLVTLHILISFSMFVVYILFEPFNSHLSTQYYLVNYCIYKTTPKFQKNDLKSVCYWFAIAVCLIQ